jgi:hypothetical protein
MYSLNKFDQGFSLLSPTWLRKFSHLQEPKIQYRAYNSRPLTHTLSNTNPFLPLFKILWHIIVSGPSSIIGLFLSVLLLKLLILCSYLPLVLHDMPIVLRVTIIIIGETIQIFISPNHLEPKDCSTKDVFYEGTRPCHQSPRVLSHRRPTQEHIAYINRI